MIEQMPNHYADQRYYTTP